MHSREDRGESRGHPVYAGPLAYLLRNRFYIGEVAFKDEIYARLPCLAMEYNAGKGGAKNYIGVPDRDGDEVNGNEEACPPCSQKS